MHFTQKTLKTLEFDKIINMLADCALTEGARAQALSLTPSSDFATVARRQALTDAAKVTLAQRGYPPFGGVLDVSDAVARAEKGATISSRELLNIAAVLTTARALGDYCSEKTSAGLSPELGEIFSRLLPNRSVEARITRTILTEDMIADEASTELADLRRKMRAANNRIKETLQKYLSGSYAKFLQENLVTTRDGRYVVPVKAEYRHEVKGLIHDTSSSGATVFIEPMGVVEANNELRLLENKEKKEVERILAELSALCADNSGTIMTDYHQITELAFLFSCASLAEKMHASRPKLTEDNRIALHRARHPLLPPDKVVPIDVSLGHDYTTLVITGPNTGGKTVTLKTLGLLALMVQSGLQIPTAETSEIGVFSEVLSDIGDEQSIEQSLSTFSAHMVNLVSILRELSCRSLVLLDELGAGTDPIEGAALATAVLEAIRATGALTAATTHYAELKVYALETNGVTNASCEFNVETLQPTYRLIIGTPGKSNAFAISEKLGLPAAIIANARALVSGNSKRFEQVIDKLEESRMEMERNRAEAEQLRVDYEKLKTEAERQLKEQQNTSAAELDKAREKARQILESARATSDFVMKQLDDVRKKQDAKSFGKDLADAKRALRTKMQETADEVYRSELPAWEEHYELPRELRVGDRVFLPDIGQEGVVTALPDRSGNVTVRAGILTTKTPIAHVRLIDGTAYTKQKGSRTSSTPKAKSGGIKTPVSSGFRAELDVRGMIGEDAWEAVDKYLDDAVLSGIQSVRIIHGKGTGALRSVLQSELRHDHRVASYRNGAYGEGDLGVTVVELK